MKKLIGYYSVENFNGAFFLARIKVTVSVPRHLHVRVTQTACDFLDIYSLVHEQRSVCVPKIVYPDVRKPRCFRERFVVVLD